MPDFSIIIPVYNVERSIRKCLRSLSCQQYDSYEIILVDDGSTDRSGEICDEAVAKDSHIQVIHQYNAGPSTARNRGIEQANGAIITFVDADDLVTENYLSEISDAFRNNQKTDVVFWGYTEISEDGRSRMNHIPHCSSIDVLATAMELSRQGLFGYTWIKAVRSDVVGDIRFPEDMSLLEDEVFICKVLQNARKMAVIEKPLYYYRMTSGSLMGSTRQDYCQLLDRVFLEWSELLDGTEISEGILREKANHMADNCQYYFFERDLEQEAFLKSLVSTHFFKRVTLDTPFVTALKRSDFEKVKKLRRRYQFKNRLAGIIRGE